MGVAGLWEVLRSAGQVRSLTELAVIDGFDANPSHHRGFRIGIDASIWFFHATYGREGENPELRTLFFRCCRLLHAPLLPLFVFDGPNRPAIKRGKRVGGNTHWLTQGMKNIIEAFGFEWRVAPGEAEAELAYLNRVDIIDAVLSDDVDNFLFGAIMVIRNPSSTLSGNRAHPVKNAQGKDDGNHVVTYAADAILNDPSVGLSRSGTILVGLLSGGDYIPAGLPGCGQKFATGLARAGFGDSLVKAVKELKGAKLDAFLDQWRQDIRAELKTNKSGCLPSKKPSLAASLPDDFPSLPVLLSYVDPITSENTPPTKGSKKPPPGMWRNDPDPMRIASLCELYFEWGVKDVIVHRFRTVLWPGIVCRAVRRTAVDEDTRRRPTQGKTTHTHSENETADDASPTKRMASTLSTLNLTSPSKKSSTSGPSSSDSSASPPFSLSALVPLTSPTSSRAASRSSPTSSDPNPSPLLLEILSHRAHASTDDTPEYRVLIDPTTLVERAESGVKGLRPPLVGGLFGIDPEEEEESANGSGSGNEDDAGGIERLETTAAAASKSGVKKRKPAQRESPTTPLRLWLPSCMIQAVAPALVEAYEEKVRAKEEKRARRGKKGGAATSTKAASRKAKAKEVENDEDDVEDPVPGPSTSSKTTTARSKGKPKAVRAGIGGRRRKPKQASEAQDEAYECFDLSAGESPCSSEEDGDEVNKKGKGKSRIEVTAAKTTTKQVTNSPSKTTTANTMKDFYKVTKPANASKLGAPKSSGVKSTFAGNATGPKRVPLYEEEEDDSDRVPLPSATKTTASKTSTSRSLGPKSSVVNSAGVRGVPRYEEDEPPSSLLKTTRPLDVLRARSKAGGASSSSSSTSNSRLRATSRSIYEEEEEEEADPPRSSLSKSNASNHTQPTQPGPRAKKRPAFVNVSDTDSDVEVSDIRRPSSSSVATTVERWASGDVNGVGGMNSKSAGARRTTSTVFSEGHAGKAADVDGVIDLIARRKASKTTSTPTTSATTPVCMASVPSYRSSSAPVGSSSSSAPGLSVGSKGPVPIARSTSKLAHILLPSALESEEEGDGEGDALPTFHRGSAKFPAKSKGATAARPAPQPFPMQLPSESFESTPSRTLNTVLREASDDEVEIMDVFITPRGESPPQSPTPTPSVAKPRPVYASAGPSMAGKPKARNSFPTSPTKSNTQTKTGVAPLARQRRRPSTDSDIQSPRGDRDGILKSPRKSAEHTSPRHVSRSGASSPTPMADSGSRTNILEALDTREWEVDAELDPSTSPQVETERPSVGRRPRPSDESAIYISSGSEDEREDTGHCPDGAGVGGETEVDVEDDDDDDDGGETDLDLGGRADTGMILSAPPSPTRSVSVEVVEPIPKRTSKFKPAPAATSNADVRAPSPVEPRASARSWKPLVSTNDESEETAVPHPTRRLPLLVARSKRSTGTGDIIDLTSD